MSSLKKIAVQWLEEFKKSAETKLEKIAATPTKTHPVEGMYYQMTSHVLTRTGKPIPVACLTPLPRTDEIERKKTTTAHDEMRKRGVPSDFIQYELYHSEATGKRLAPLGSQGDLRSYLVKNPRVSWIIVKRLILSVFWSVHDLHKRLLVHTDIKPENYIVFFQDGMLRCKLADHQHTTIVDEEGSAADVVVTGTHGFLPPEITSPAESKTKINYFKVDAYAVGRTISEILAALKPKDTRLVDSDLKTIIKKLREEDREKRISVIDAAKEGFFKRNKRSSVLPVMKVKGPALMKYQEDAKLPISVTSPIHIAEPALQPLIEIIECAKRVGEEIENFTSKLIKLNSNTQIYSAIIEEFQKLKNSVIIFLAKAEPQEKIPLYSAHILQLMSKANKDFEEITTLIHFPANLSMLFKKAVQEVYGDFVKQANAKNRPSFLLDDWKSEVTKATRFVAIVDKGCSGTLSAESLVEMISMLDTSEIPRFKKLLDTQLNRLMFNFRENIIKNMENYHHEESSSTSLEEGFTTTSTIIPTNSTVGSSLSHR